MLTEIKSMRKRDWSILPHPELPSDIPAEYVMPLPDHWAAAFKSVPPLAPAALKAGVQSDTLAAGILAADLSTPDFVLALAARRAALAATVAEAAKPSVQTAAS